VSKIAGSIVTLFLLLFWAGEVAAAGRCWGSTSSVSFGSYDVLSSTPTDTTGNISVYCNQENYTTASIGPSANSGGFNPRRMKYTTGTDLLNYNLYANASKTQIWGNGTGGTFTVSETVARFTTVNLPVYGRIHAGQDVSAGLYADALTVTVSW